MAFLLHFYTTKVVRVGKYYKFIVKFRVKKDAFKKFLNVKKISFTFFKKIAVILSKNFSMPKIGDNEIIFNMGDRAISQKTQSPIILKDVGQLTPLS